jgi:hypothetical protein
VDWPLELIVVPVSDVDRAKTFYLEQAGFNVDVDHRGGEDFGVVQLTPPRLACSIALMRNTAAAGSLQGLHLVVSDIDAARAELVKPYRRTRQTGVPAYRPTRQPAYGWTLVNCDRGRPRDPDRGRPRARSSSCPAIVLR